MKQSILDVLIFLFEYYMHDDMEFTPYRDELQEKLQRAGFNYNVIDDAFNWLENLTELEEGELIEHHALSMRIFHPAECEKISLEGRRLLISLEQKGILKPHQRELVIDQIMVLDEEIDADQMKWVILMILFNQEDNNYPTIEEFLFNQQDISWH